MNYSLPHHHPRPQMFNGGSDFNEPVKRCLDRLTDAKWANSDILLVSGEAGGTGHGGTWHGGRESNRAA